MKLLQGLSLALLGAIVIAEKTHESGHASTSLSSAGDTSSPGESVPPIPAETTPAGVETKTKRKVTVTHSVARGATALPNGDLPKPRAEGNETLAAHRRLVDEQMADGETMVFEVRHEENLAIEPHLQARQPSHGKHQLPFFREWIWCHAKGYDPWMDFETITGCFWDKARGDGDGKWTCDNREMYMWFMMWENRTEAVFGCGACFTWCYGTKHPWCDCSEETDFHTHKVFLGFAPIAHTYTPGWQNSYTQYLSTTFLGQWVGSSWRQKRAQPATLEPRSSITKSPVGIESFLNTTTTTFSGTGIESNVKSFANATAVKNNNNNNNNNSSSSSSSSSSSNVQRLSSAAAEKQTATSTRSSIVKPHITPAPTSWRRGGAPEWHTYTPAANHTGGQVYSSILAREGIIDAEGNLNPSLVGDSPIASQYGWLNGTGKATSGDITSSTMQVDARAIAQAPPWHHKAVPPQGLSCFSQGYSPQINDTIYYFLRNEAENNRRGEWQIDMPWDVNASISLVFWNSPSDCLNACKDCLAWGIKDQRNLVWCDYRIGFLTTCHAGFEPIDGYIKARTDYWGDYITKSYPTQTDHWYTTPESLIMASDWRLTPWLPMTPVVTSTHFYADGTHNAVATGKPPYWDVYCTAAYGGAELAEWQTTHTRTNWEWSGWYTYPTGDIFATSTPTPTPTSTHSHVYATVYPTPRAIAQPQRPGAHAVRLQMQDKAASEQDCLNSCNPCIDWAFTERRQNVSCIVQPKHEHYVGLCEADFSLSIEPTSTSSQAPSTPAFVPVWPTTWDKPKIINGTLIFSPVVWTATNSGQATPTTEWWHGKTRLPSE